MRLPVVARRDLGRHVGALLRPHRRTLVLLSSTVVLSAGALVAAPLLIRQAIDDGVRRGDATVVERAALWLAVLAVIGAGLSWWRVRLSGVVAEGVLEQLRAVSARRVLALAVGDLRGTTRGDVVARLTGDIEMLSDVLRRGAPQIVQAGSMLMVSMTVLVIVSPTLAAVGLAGLVVVWWRARVMLRRIGPVYADYRERLGDALGTMSETVAGIRSIQGARREDDRAAAYRAVNDDVAGSLLGMMRLRNRFYPQLILLQAGATLAVVVVGTVLATAGRTTVGTVSAAVLAVVAVYRPVEEIADWLDEVSGAGAALGRVAGLLDLKPGLAAAATPVPLPTHGELVLDQVGFRYADARGTDSAPVVDGVSLTIGAGERVALVGATGAGKSTLARLVARLDDPADGRVTFGGVDLRDAAFDEVRRRIVLTPQEGHLVEGTIADNVRLARPDATDDDVRTALDRIGARSWVAGLPHGIDTDVASLGSRLSAGERQLVALARVALADPRLVVLDEATSALDLGTELMVERAMARALDGRAVLVIAHRATTAARADRVALMSDGRLVEVGRHDELVVRGGAYAELWDAWSRSAG